MTQRFRRLVTGRDANGKSVLLEDTLVEEARMGNFNLWRTGGVGMPADVELVRGEIPFYADPGGSIFRIFTLPAAEPGMSPKALRALSDEFFAGIGDPACRVDTTLNPFMHQTPTIDYVLLLSGQVSLLLEQGDAVPLKPFDAVVQRNTNHAWINTGGEAAILMAVMIGRA